MRHSSITFWCSPVIIFLTIPILSSRTAVGESEAERLEFFESKIRPVLVEYCYECHSTETGVFKADLGVDTRDGLLQGGSAGPVIEPGDPEASPLIWAIRYDDPLLRMPPSGKLPDEVIAAFEHWIAQGAIDPRIAKPRVEESASVTTVGEVKLAIDWKAALNNWAFQKPESHQPSLSKSSAQPGHQSRIDTFVLERLDSEGLQPNPEADRRTLIRRLSFDLIGLPPSPEEVEALVHDPDPAALEAYIDGLLASPRFGERWARPWLDLGRYAEDQAHIVGNNQSLFYPNAYLYRDWVINAFNNDLPIDQFIRLQLAADLISPDDESDDPALGFIGLGPKYYRRGSPEVMAEEWEDRVDVVSRGLLGLTVACARCHDHKFDPIPTEDYYAIAGVFASTSMFNRPLHDEVETNKNGEAKSPEDALHIIREGKPRDLPVYIRGNVDQHGETARRHFLQVLSQGAPETLLGDESTSGRLELAEAIVDPENPLTARVFVNRIWGSLFGNPIVGTPSNFGSLGESPTHPELLDDLSARFIAEGKWSLKWLIREIVHSNTYRQSSEITDAHRAIDPENRLLARMTRKRLSVEAWRDTILAVSGRLEHSLGGPSIDPSDPEATRRTIYSRISRLDLNPMLARFDFPDPNAHSATRAETTTPLQKLFVLNSPFITKHTEALANRISQESADDLDARVDLAYQLLFARSPTDSERALGRQFLQADEENERWFSYIQALLASNELLILD